MAEKRITVEHPLFEHALTVNSETMQLHCHLPTDLTLQNEQSYARFWHKQVTANLTERDILRHFLTGLHTPLEGRTRSYLTPFGEWWLLRMGSMSTEL